MDIQQPHGSACYLRGTRILTSSGQVPVEDLAVGNRLVTYWDELMTLTWIGRRGYQDWTALSNPAVQPVRFKTGALADWIPSRDLLVSPEHAMFLNGVLISARRLVNGVSIVKEQELEDIQYFHLELEQHAVIFAENAASESFLDRNSRNIFNNALEFYALYPDARNLRAAPSCARHVEDGYELEALRRMIMARAKRLLPDGAATPVPALRGRVDLVTRTAVEGWAFEDAADAPVKLVILNNGAVIGRVIAGSYRSDLKAAGIGNGRHSFRFLIPRPLTADLQHVLEVRRESDWGALPNSPVILEPETSSFQTL